MAGFNSPNILFLNTYDAPDRKYIKELAPKLKANGYEKYVELYCGAFVMPLIVSECGFKPEDMYCYDVSLFSNILGYTFSGQPLSELKVKKNGELIELNGKDEVENAAILLYEQAVARLKKAEHIEYFRFLLDDMIASGLPDELLNSVNADNQVIDIPQLSFDWRIVNFTFLPKQLKDLETLAKAVDSKADLVGVADAEQYQEFCNALSKFGKTKNVTSISTMLSLLVEIALKEVEKCQQEDQALTTQNTISRG